MRYNPQGTGASSESLTNYKVIRIGDVAFEGHTNREFQYGRFVVNDLGDGIMSPRFSVLRPVGPFNISYWKQYLHCERYINRILVRSTKAGTMMNELVYNDLSKEFVYCPSNNEQQKIGKLLSKVDFAITLHEDKKRQLERIKSALLQKIFADKSGYPAVRFEGFSAEWEQRKLGDVGKTYTGLSGKAKEDFGHGEASFVTYMNVYSNPVSDLKMTEPIEIDNHQNEVKYGDVFFTTSSETPEEVGMASVWTGDKNNTYLNSFCFGYRPLQRIDPYYLSYLLHSESVRRKIIILAQGISRYNISKKGVMKISTTFPSLDEQDQIGSLFQHIDHTITLHDQKLSFLKRLKQTLLQKMFI